MGERAAAESLTRRQQEVLDFLRAAAAAFAHPPTLDELCRAMGLASRGSMHKHISALVEAGLVEPMDHRQRGIRLAEAAHGNALFLLGRVAAGRPIEALPNPEAVEVPAGLRGRGRCYVLEVRGDSMIEAGILDGDRVVVEARECAEDGDLVIALIDGSEATLKRLAHRGGKVVLVPANGALSPMEYAPERVRIQGVVTGLLRAYR